MDISQLKTFYTVAKAGSFSKAVKELNLSQPAISRQVMLLEESLNTRLFNRHARKGLVLTVEGETLLEKTRNILKDIDALKISLKEASEPEGTLKIAISQSIGTEWLLNHLRIFMGKHPKLKLEINAVDAPVDLARDESHIYIGDYQSSMSHHIQEHLSDHRLKFYASATYLENFGTPTHPNDLASHQMLSLTSKGKTFSHQENWLDTLLSTNQAKARITVNSLDALTTATRAGLGIAGFYEKLAPADLIPVLPDYLSVIGVYVAYLDQSQKQPNIKAFVSFLKSL